MDLGDIFRTRAPATKDLRQGAQEIERKIWFTAAALRDLDKQVKAFEAGESRTVPEMKTEIDSVRVFLEAIGRTAGEMLDLL